MPRIRTVKPEFFKHWDLYRIEMITQLPIRISFQGLWLCSDKEGRFKWQVQQLKLDVLPYDKVDFEEILNILGEFDFIKKYEISSKLFGLIPTLKEHQKFSGSEAYNESKLPIPVSFLEVPKKFAGSSLEELWNFHVKKNNMSEVPLTYDDGTYKELPENLQGSYEEAQERKGKERSIRKGKDNNTENLSPEMTKKEFELFHKKIICDRIFSDPLCMTKKIDGDLALEEWLFKYDLHIAGEEKIKKDYSEYKKHFKNWICKQNTFSTNGTYPSSNGNGTSDLAYDKP